MATYKDRGGFSWEDQRAAVNELMDLIVYQDDAINGRTTGLKLLVKAAFEGNEEARLRLYRIDGAVSRLWSALQMYKDVCWHRPYESMEDAASEGAWPFNQSRGSE